MPEARTLLRKPDAVEADDWQSLLRLAKSGKQVPPFDGAAARAAAGVLADLRAQGWVMTTSRDEIHVGPPSKHSSVDEERSRVRNQELLKRAEQLSTKSVREFVQKMEAPREWNGSFVSIFSLMRDGTDLAAQLRELAKLSEPSATQLRAVIDPYIQVVHDSRERCPQTGLRLVDIWRYFRHTWTNQYGSTPGRSMSILVRDRAAPFHPIVGIAALGSSIVQLAERDEWIGWSSDSYVEALRRKPTKTAATWCETRLAKRLSEIYVLDLIEDGLYSPAYWNNPTAEVIEQLRSEAVSRRNDHQRFGRRSEFTDARSKSASEWEKQARSSLYRSKRCSELADLLETRIQLADLLEEPTAKQLGTALTRSPARKALKSLVRSRRGEVVGTEIADLTVCGAVAPYSHLLGGKLVAMLAVSPTIVREYRFKYTSAESQIASSMAGAPIRRSANLSFIGTTSLYGSNSSQYNRIVVPPDVLGGDHPLRYEALGRSRSFGTSHFSSATVRALVDLSEQATEGARVKSIFGEGVSPKLRKVRGGLDELGWPSEVLLRHGRERIIYGVSLIENLLPYLMGTAKSPRYKFNPAVVDDVDRIGSWWATRWLLQRIQQDQILDAVSTHSTHVRPVTHGARVSLPPATDD